MDLFEDQLFGSLVFDKPEHLTTSPAGVAHIPFAYWLVEKLAPRTAVALGGSANLYGAVCQAVKRLALPTECVGVGCADVAVEDHDSRYGSFSRVLSIPAADARACFADGSVDLLLLDGAAETEAWRGKLSERAVVLITGTHDGAARQLWDELKGGHPSFSFLHAQGLGVVVMGASAPAVLGWLCGAASPALVRTFFSRLGEGLANELRVGALERDVDDLQQAFDVMDERTRHNLDRQRGEIVGLTEQIQDLGRVNTELMAQNGEIPVLQWRLAKTEYELDQALAALRRHVWPRPGQVVEAFKRSVTKPLAQRREINQLRASGRVDVTWYLNTYPDVAAAKIDPVTHYVQSGADEGRNPNPGFDTRAYWRSHPDSVEVNPLLHALQNGGGTETSEAQPAPAAGQVSAALLQRVGALESGLHDSWRALNRERHRIDYALTATEGFLADIDTFHQARATADYQAAFDASEPLVSICVPTYNRPDLLLERCVRSLREQTYRNLQIVIVGDHCTDDTGARLAELRDDRIVFRNLPQRGPYPPPGEDRWCVAGTSAMNAALDLAEGQFIAHLDDDDEAMPERIETMLRAAQERRADFCWHSFRMESDDGDWRVVGDGQLLCGQITTGSTFYHRYFTRYKWDVHAYRSGEPGDWNRLRKIKMLRPRLHFVPTPLMSHYKERNQAPFVAQPGETFLD